MTGYEAAWPDDSRSNEVHQQQVEDRRRMQEDIQRAWFNVTGRLEYSDINELESDIKLLRWALGVK